MERGVREEGGSYPLTSVLAERQRDASRVSIVQESACDQGLFSFLRDARGERGRRAKVVREIGQERSWEEGEAVEGLR